MRRAALIIVVLVPLAVVAAYLLRSCGTLDRPRLPAGRIWFADTASGPRVLLLTEREFTRPSRLRSRRFERYELQTHDADSGARLARATVAEYEDRGASPTVDIIGVTGDRIWLWHGELEARDANTLAVVVTDAQLRAANPGLAFGTERDFYGVGPDPAAPAATRPAAIAGAGLVAKTLDGRYVHIDPQTLSGTELTTSPVTDIYGRMIKLNDWFRSASKWPPGFAMPQTTPASGWGGGLNGAIVNDRVVIIASEEERLDLSPLFNRPSAVYGDVRRRLMSGATTRDGSNVSIDPARLQPLSQVQYLAGGFLAEPRNAEQPAWILDGTLLLVSLSQLGDGGQLVLDRILPDGTALWTARLGIAELTAFGDAGPTLLFAGYVNLREPTALRPFVMVLVEKERGAVRTYALREDTVAAR